MIAVDTWRHRILSLDDGEEWDALVNAVPHHDVFFSASYVATLAGPSGEGARLFVFGDRQNYVVYPFFCRRVNDLPFYQADPLDDCTGYFDIISPYGYSGPIARIHDQSREGELWRGFREDFHQYCLANQIVSEFARLNPFVGNHQQLLSMCGCGNVRARGEIVYVDLRGSTEDLWRGLNRGNRSSIGKARRSGVEVRRGQDEALVRRFYELYGSTMYRNRASHWYHFPLEFFREGFALLGERISLFSATYEGEVVAAATFLHDGEVVHYFLGGSASKHWDLRPNNMLMYEAICWARQQGYRFFNLGGGQGAKDSLARFKASFSPLTTTFYTFQMVHNPVVYDELCRRHAKYLLSRDYFPGYRTVGS